MQREEIERLIPIRDPYLWIDEVIEISTNEIHARKYLSEDLEVFRGHFVDFPVFPGALQCECVFQAAGILMAQSESAADECIPVIARMNNVKFRKMVRPGDTLDIRVELIDRRRHLVHLRGSIEVNGKITTQLEFAATKAERGITASDDQ